MEKFCCKDCGLNCAYETTGVDERQLTRKVLDHMHTAHDMEAIPADTMMKIYSSIRKNDVAGKVSRKIAAGPLAAYILLVLTPGLLL